MNLLEPLVSAGLVNALLLAAAAAAAARRDRRWAWLAGFLVVSAITLISIVLQHRTDGAAQSFAVAAEQISWTSGPLLYCFVCRASGYSVRGRFVFRHLALPALVVVMGTPLIIFGRFEPLPTSLLVLFQMAYTLACGWTLLTRPQSAGRDALTYWAPLGAVATMTGIHVAQTLRWTHWGRINADTVPLVASLAILLALLGLLLLPRPIAQSAARYSRSGLKPDEARALYAAAMAELLRDKVFARDDLSLADVADALGVKAHRLSQAISAGGETSFSEMLLELRVDEARRLLADPRNAKVALEPIGMEAGFRSRSGFYAAFKGRTGMTPGEYRLNVSCLIGEDKPLPDMRAAPA